VYLGQAGAGQVARTVNDLLRWASVLAIYDAFSLAQASGADTSTLRDAILAGSGSTRALEQWGSTDVSEARQDLQAAWLLASETGATMPFLQHLEGVAKELYPEQLNTLFNLGIADLSPAVESEPSSERPALEADGESDGASETEDDLPAVEQPIATGADGDEGAEPPIEGFGPPVAAS